MGHYTDRCIRKKNICLTEITRCKALKMIWYLPFSCTSFGSSLFKNFSNISISFDRVSFCLLKYEEYQIFIMHGYDSDSTKFQCPNLVCSLSSRSATSPMSCRESIGNGLELLLIVDSTVSLPRRETAAAIFSLFLYAVAMTTLKI